MAKEQLFQSYLSTAASLVKNFRGTPGFPAYLKGYFALHKKFGSRDRKYISQLCYSYFRCPPLVLENTIGWFRDLGLEERMVVALFVCSVSEDALLLQLKPEWNEKVGLPLVEKLRLAGNPFTPAHIFPWSSDLSNGIDSVAFREAQLIQPDLFIRIRPGFRENIESRLKAARIGFLAISDSCYSISNTTDISKVLRINAEVIIQDYSSQSIAIFFQLISQRTSYSGEGPSIWDCCAASGGKSLLAFDWFEKIRLTVSDIRPAILENLTKRFAEAGIRNYHSFLADLTSSQDFSPGQQYDLVICDVPCSGSGTWGRTPEQRYFFEPGEIDYYAERQKKILKTVIPAVKKKGYLLYITCSVFTRENEEMVEFITGCSSLSLIHQQLLKGYDRKADTLFAALFTA